MKFETGVDAYEDWLIENISFVFLFNFFFICSDYVKSVVRCHSDENYQWPGINLQNFLMNSFNMNCFSISYNGIHFKYLQAQSLWQSQSRPIQVSAWLWWAKRPFWSVAEAGRVLQKILKESCWSGIWSGVIAVLMATSSLLSLPWWAQWTMHGLNTLISRMMS